MNTSFVSIQDSNNNTGGVAFHPDYGEVLKAMLEIRFQATGAMCFAFRSSFWVCPTFLERARHGKM